MANPATPLILLMLISLLAAIEGAQNSTELKWAKKLKTRKKTTSETVTNLQFYFHDTVSGKTPSAVRVAQATDTNKSPTLFGALLMADDPLTETPDPNSKLVGRAQGLYGSSCQQELGLIMAMNFGFTDGMYNGSSISILGKNQAMNLVREMPVVAGTGVFRLGRGYAIAKTHWIDFTTGDAIVGYNVTVIH
ncbi:dirigent protein 23 [Prunus yedoensis var. nudiflora]|uniref:Dirigent protein n=1 Tax=Prunus yedoensis var. nudiflora TaxID=2094558 RepID=A0A314YB89_PRUYE|nr:dirigent protein 23 [Prunus yedoensis var. nudiflora]